MHAHLHVAKPLHLSETEARLSMTALLREERLRDIQSDGAKALGRLAGSEARELLLALVSEPHANGAVVAAALDQLARSGTRRPGPSPTPSAAIRARVRAAARAVRPSPAFDPVAALASPPVARLLDDFGRLLVAAPRPTPIGCRRCANGSTPRSPTR